MVLSNNLQTPGLKPSGRFVTTYSSDYKPSSERPVLVNQPKAEAAPASFNLLHTERETWPTFYQFFYKTANSTYGSFPCLQPPSCYRPLASPSPFGILNPSISETRIQEVSVAWETGHVLGGEEKGQLHCVCSGFVNVLEQQEQKTGALCKKDVTVLSSLVDPAYCEDFLRYLCREARLQHLLDLPVASSPIITNTDGENRDNGSFWRGSTPATGLQNVALIQPTSWQCSCCAWETERPSCHFEMQTFSLHNHQGSNLPLAHVLQNINCIEPRRSPPLTEYQSSYAAEWAQSKIRMNDFPHQRSACH